MSLNVNGDLAEQAQQQINSYFDAIRNNIQMQSSSLSELSKKNEVLNQKQQIQLNQLKEIEDKEKLLLTRSRMLQISQDRNAYKKKIIYSLIALIFAIFIFTLVMYVLFIRKMGMAK
jgi:hypothetical protein